VILGPYVQDSFAGLGLERDLVAAEADGRPAARIGWTHRRSQDFDLYFISNQTEAPRRIDLSLRVSGRRPELWDPVDGDIRPASTWSCSGGRTRLPVSLAPSGSVFVVFREPDGTAGRQAGANWPQPEAVQSLDHSWSATFAAESGGPAGAVAFDRLEDWTARPEPGIRNYSGTAEYRRLFQWIEAPGKKPRVWLDLGRVADIAEVSVNGVPCGVAWTFPYRVEIGAALRPGTNELAIAVTNTWANRIVADHGLPENQRLTWTTAPYHFPEGAPLLSSGLLGPVVIEEEQP
jgi:hypothetical protein